MRSSRLWQTATAGKHADLAFLHCNFGVPEQRNCHYAGHCGFREARAIDRPPACGSFVGCKREMKPVFKRVPETAAAANPGHEASWRQQRSHHPPPGGRGINQLACLKRCDKRFGGHLVGRTSGLTISFNGKYRPRRRAAENPLPMQLLSLHWSQTASAPRTRGDQAANSAASAATYNGFPTDWPRIRISASIGPLSRNDCSPMAYAVCKSLAGRGQGAAGSSHHGNGKRLQLFAHLYH